MPKQRPLEQRYIKRKTFVKPFIPNHTKKTKQVIKKIKSEIQIAPKSYSFLTCSILFVATFFYIIFAKQKKSSYIQKPNENYKSSFLLESFFINLESKCPKITYVKSVLASLIIVFECAIISSGSNNIYQSFLFSLSSLCDSFLVNTITQSYSFSFLLLIFIISIYLLTSFTHVQNRALRLLCFTVSILLASICVTFRIEFFIMFIPILGIYIVSINSLLSILIPLLSICLSIGFIIFVDQKIGIPQIVMNKIDAKELIKCFIENDFNSLIVPLLMVPIFWPFMTSFDIKGFAFVLFLFFAVICVFLFSISSQDDTCLMRALIGRIFVAIGSGFVLCHQTKRRSFVLVLIVLVVTFFNFYFLKMNLFTLASEVRKHIKY